jgi:hypothetical protein
MQMLPPMVAAFQILKEARNARQHSRSSGAAFQPAGALNRSSSAIVQVAAISSPVSTPAGRATPASEDR